MPLPGFDASTRMSSHTINGKKTPMQDFETDFITEKSYDEKSDQENQIPNDIAVKSSSQKNAANSVANGHTMCLRPLSVDNTKDQIHDNVSLLTDNFSSLHKVSEAVSSSTNEGQGHGMQKEMLSYPLAGSRSEESAANSTSSDRYATPETPAHSGSTNMYTEMMSNGSQPVVVQGHHIHQPAQGGHHIHQRNRENALSPTSEATTAVVSHRQRSSAIGFYNNSRERRSVRVARVVGGKNRRATSFATRARARRVITRRNAAF
jgi:hypothetical protein